MSAAVWHCNCSLCHTITVSLHGNCFTAVLRWDSWSTWILEDLILTTLHGETARRRRKILGFLSSFHVRECIFLNDFEHFRGQNPQKSPPAAGCLRERFSFFPLWERKTAQNPLMGKVLAGPPITHRGGGVISYIRRYCFNFLHSHKPYARA